MYDICWTNKMMNAKIQEKMMRVKKAAEHDVKNVQKSLFENLIVLLSWDAYIAYISYTNRCTAE